jgi:hypothetical protein
MADAQPNPARQYFVVSHRTGWEIIADGDPLAWFSDQAHAVQHAVEWAREYASDGRTSEVLLEAGPDDFKVVWVHED